MFQLVLENRTLCFYFSKGTVYDWRRYASSKTAYSCCYVVDADSYVNLNYHQHTIAAVSHVVWQLG